MKKVAKYPLNVSTVPQTIEMPENSEIVGVDIDPENNKPAFWAVHRTIDEGEAPIERTFKFALTDKEFRDTDHYLGGVFWERGEDDFVHLHLLEVLD